jgi:hypothetical protein
MSSYPLSTGDNAGLMNAVNYLLSGPAALGQNFQGFSDYNLGHITGNQRTPFTQLSYTYIAYGNSGENTIVVPDNSGLLVGMRVRGPGIASYPTSPSTTTIVSIGELTVDGSIITLSANNINSVNNIVVFTQTTKPYTYQSPLSLSTAEMLDSRTYKYTFSTPYTTIDTDRVVPFSVGQAIVVSGVTNSAYNLTFSPIGVVECTTTYVIARTLDDNTIVSNSSGGSVTFSITTNTASTYPAKYNYIHTDCNGFARVDSGTDRVFISAQLNNRFGVNSDISGTMNVLVVINRYIVTKSTDPNSPANVYTYDKTLTGKAYSYSIIPGFQEIPGPINSGNYVETIFTTVIDVPPIGYYWYVLDIAYNGTTTTMQVVYDDLNLRSLSSQVVKQ